MVKKFLINAAFLISFFCVFSSVAKAEITEQDFTGLYLMTAPDEDSRSLCKDQKDHPACVAEASMFRSFMWPEKGPQPDLEFTPRISILYKFVSMLELNKQNIPPQFSSKWKAGDRAVFISELTCWDTSRCGKYSTETERRRNINNRCPTKPCRPRGEKLANSTKTCPFIAIVRNDQSSKTWNLIDRFASDDKDSCIKDMMKLISVSDLPW